MDKLSDFTGRAERQPYQLDLGDGTVMSVAHPTNLTWREAVATDDLGGFLRVLGVDADTAEHVAAAFGDSDFGSEHRLVAKMSEHFGKGN